MVDECREHLESKPGAMARQRRFAAKRRELVGQRDAILDILHGKRVRRRPRRQAALAGVTGTSQDNDPLVRQLAGVDMGPQQSRRRRHRSPTLGHRRLLQRCGPRRCRLQWRCVEAIIGGLRRRRRWRQGILERFGSVQRLRCQEHTAGRGPKGRRQATVGAETDRWSGGRRRGRQAPADVVRQGRWSCRLRGARGEARRRQAPPPMGGALERGVQAQLLLEFQNRRILMGQANRNPIATRQALSSPSSRCSEVVAASAVPPALLRT
mmetsp:Transcript_36540/g.105246  ORF Transcript_36540/g.105246 Transcript_36540/m.105246 type:complete len:267 (-) Transcript_36540:88-888(-)